MDVYGKKERVSHGLCAGGREDEREGEEIGSRRKSRRIIN